MANRYKSQEINKGSISEIVDLINAFSSGHQKEKESIGLGHEAIQNVITSSQTPEQLINAKNALANIKERSLEYDSTSLNYIALENSLNNKQFAYDNFSNAMDESADFFNSNKYMPKAESWTDLDSTRKSITDSDGLEVYDSNVDMISQQYLKLNTLKSKILEGTSQGKDGHMFRIPKGMKIGDGQFDANDIAFKLDEYQNTLDKALSAMVGDEIITDEEANEIVNGRMDKQGFLVYRKEKMNEFKEQMNSSTQELKYLNKESIKNATENDMSFLQGINPDVDWQGMKDNLTTGNEVAFGTILEQEISKAKGKQNQARIGYKNWSGSLYADLPILDSSPKDLIQFADIDGDGVLSLEEEQQQTRDIADLEQAFDDIEKKELDKTNKELMDRYGTTDPSAISEILSKIKGNISDTANKEEVKKIIREEQRKGEAPKVRGVGVDIFSTGSQERAQKFNVHPSLQKEVDERQPYGFGYGYNPGDLEFNQRIMDKSNRLREKEFILDGTDKASTAMNEFLTGSLNMNQAMTKGKYSDSDITEIVGQKSRKKLAAFKNKFKEAMEANESYLVKNNLIKKMNIEEFIAQNKEEYYEMTKILKYGDYWFKNPRKIGKSKHYINLYD